MTTSSLLAGDLDLHLVKYDFLNNSGLIKSQYSRPKSIITIKIKEKNKDFKKNVWSKSTLKIIYVTILYMTDKIFVYYEIVR